MPTLHLAYTHPDTAARQPEPQALAAELTHLTSTLLHKRADLTAVHLQPVPPQQWWVGGTLPTDQGLAAYRLRIDVSQGTNTSDQMAAYIESVHQAMGQLLGPVHPASYVVVQEQPMAHWGWGGRSQAARLA